MAPSSDIDAGRRRSPVHGPLRQDLNGQLRLFVRKCRSVGFRYDRRPSSDYAFFGIWSRMRRKSNRIR